MQNQLCFRLLLMKYGFHDLCVSRVEFKPKIIYGFFASNNLLKNLAPMDFLLQADELNVIFTLSFPLWKNFGHVVLFEALTLWPNSCVNQTNNYIFTILWIMSNTYIGIETNNLGGYVVFSFMCRSFMEEMYPRLLVSVLELHVLLVLD
jgi:hypothetical protein